MSANRLARLRASYRTVFRFVAMTKGATFKKPTGAYAARHPARELAAVEPLRSDGYQPKHTCTGLTPHGEMTKRVPVDWLREGDATLKPLFKKRLVRAPLPKPEPKLAKLPPKYAWQKD